MRCFYNRFPNPINFIAVSYLDNLLGQTVEETKWKKEKLKGKKNEQINLFRHINFMMNPNLSANSNPMFCTFLEN